MGNMKDISIIKIEDKASRHQCYDLLIRASKVVATNLNMTEINCPSYTAFMDFSTFSVKATRNTQFYAFYLEDLIVACGGLEISSENLAKVKLLATENTYQHRGFGQKMLEHLEGVASDHKCRSISLGAISENLPLIKWYEKKGYKTIKKKTIKQGVFHVQIMKKMG